KNEFKKMVTEAVEESFNSISIDGCMSTNDTVFVISSNKVVLDNENEKKIFFQKLKDICLDLAKMIVKDGEGATKFIEIQINGAKTKQEAKAAGMALANSTLLKCAFYGANSNWGRIISALGQAGIKVKETINIRSTNLEKKNIKMTVDLGRGEFCRKIFTTDLTPEYIDINAEYS
ncbi:MAG: bifunctional ornithine acetyltransferase/N-acetylglutamate synthase, partial [Candidatus Omnitrophica bacterium]|nr:bifunctional ornithine acetyltransferase/N-acetylglutamate synthase [Candidatus Omnitrophota bacterium]